MDIPHISSKAMTHHRMTFLGVDAEADPLLDQISRELWTRGWADRDGHVSTREDVPSQSASPYPPSRRDLEVPPVTPPATVPVAEPQLLKAPALPVSDAGAGHSFAQLPSAGDDGALDPLMQETSRHLRNIGRVNILVAGQTGVGKSTLINSVFGESFAETASGRPVTQFAEWYSSETVPLRILDTKGLEAKDYASTLQDMRAEIERCRNEKETRDQLHIGWVCIATPSSRVQDCEVDIVRVLNKYDIPAIVVLTKDDEDPDFPGIVAGILDDRHAKYAAVVSVRALARRSTPVYGLDDLVTATYRALPAAHRAAFAASQKINRDLNREAAEEYVTAASAAAAAASVIPIPFADLATLAPIQAGMLVGISAAFGLALDRTQISRLLTTTLGSLALSLAGRWAVGNVLKFIPGPGSIIGSVVNAAMSGAITRTMGRTYIRFLYEFLETHGRVPSADEILEIFPKFYKSSGTEAHPA